MTDFRIKKITAMDTHQLRHKVLRPNQPIEACSYPNDGEPTTFHFGAFLGDRLVGIASVYQEVLTQQDYRDILGFRLRGMAVAPELQSTGIGGGLLEASIKEATLMSQENKAVFWANARTSAIGFYERFNMRATGDEFEVENIGPHFVVCKNL